MLQTITIKNPTKCFVPWITKLSLTIPKSTTFSYRRSKELSYQVRLYYEFLHCTNISKGKCFYYTLTYNDAHIPQMFGKNVFDYKDIRHFINGAFYKYVTKSFNCELKYCVFGERGEGKGIRGYGNNPHYHIILFFRDKSGQPFKVPESTITELVRNYWQGDSRRFDESGVDPRKFTFGIVSEGSEGAEVLDYRAFSYCCKYCTKSSSDICTDKQLENMIIENVKKNFLTDNDILKEYYYFIHPNKTCPIFLRYEDLKVKPDVIFNHFEQELNHRIHLAIKNFRNRHCARVRISNGVGSYALEHAYIDKDNLKVLIPTKDGYKAVPSGLYLFRKKFMEVRKCPDTGHPYYAYTDAGLDFREQTICLKISQLYHKTLGIFNSFINDKNLYQRLYSLYNTISDVDYKIPSYLTFFQIFPNDSETLNNLIYDYSIYKLIYQDRYFFTKDWTDIDSSPSLDVLADYRSFISDTRKYASCYDYDRTTTYVGGLGYAYPYGAHPLFAQNIERFIVLDYLSDYISYLKDEEDQRESEHRKLIRQFHNNTKYVNYSTKN